MEKTALIIFAREPRDGKVKTRLLKDLPAGAVTRLYKVFIRDVLKTALKASVTERFIYYTGGNPSLPFLGRFKGKFRLKRQQGRDLGTRMYRAFVNSREAGFDKTVIIGTDCPSLTDNDIQNAFNKLLRYDIILGPSKDGGYYLLGLNRPHQRLFSNIPWSTNAVLSMTRQRAEKLKKKVYLLVKRQDIDTIEDLKESKKGDYAKRRYGL